ncbi:MAG: Rdx family protein [Nitrospirae bacterium]|nr:Rdx family protein [Nitrospirota bacterium]
MTEIAIEYCGTCNYRPIAAALAIAIEKAIGLKPVLVHSREAGAFEVSVDGEVVFSKRTSGVFPNPSEIIEILRIRTGRTEGRHEG